MAIACSILVSASIFLTFFSPLLLTAADTAFAL